METQKSTETAPMEPLREIAPGPVSAPTPEHLKIEKSDLDVERFGFQPTGSVSVVTPPVPSIPPASADSAKSKSADSNLSTASVKEGSTGQAEGGSDEGGAGGKRASPVVPSDAESGAERIGSPLPPSESEVASSLTNQSAEVMRQSQHDVGPMMNESEEEFAAGTETKELASVEEGEASGKRKKRREMKAMRDEPLTVTSGKEAACCVCLIASIITLLAVLFLVSVFANTYMDTKRSPEDKSKSSL